MDWNNYFKEQIDKASNHSLNKVTDFTGNQTGGSFIFNAMKGPIKTFIKPQNDFIDWMFGWKKGNVENKAVEEKKLMSNSQ